MDEIVQLGVEINLALQTLPWLTAPMRAFSFLGSEEFFLLLLPALYWCWDARLGLGVGTMLLGSVSLNTLLKLAFTAPRPYWADSRVLALQRGFSYGLPSGHAQHALAIWGFLATQLRRGWAWIALLALIFLISLSRLSLGVHYPLDVLSGWVVGAALLAAYLRWEAPVRAWLSRLGLGAQLGLALGLSLAYAAVGAGVLGAIAPVVDPAEWETTARAALTAQGLAPEAGQPAIEPRDPRDIAASAGLLLGWGAALALLARGPRFDAGGPWSRRAARFGVGLIGLLVFYFGLRLLSPEEPLAAHLVMRWLRHALTVFWALYLAPRLFIRLRLA